MSENQTIGEFVAEEGPEETGQAEPVGSSDWREQLQFLFTKTGPGTVESYLENPFCFKRSLGLAQVLRGLSGFLGGLDYALVDVAVGLFRWRSESVSDSQSVNF